jgi:hypothetical protein
VRAAAPPPPTPTPTRIETSNPASATSFDRNDYTHPERYLSIDPAAADANDHREDRGRDPR